MFRVENNVPEVYIAESRDFQLVSRLYDLVLQATRFSIDSIEDTSDTMRCNNRLLSLLSTKVGLFGTVTVPDAAYRQVLSAFPYIIKHKGSIQGLQLVVNLFERITNYKIYLDIIDDQLHIVQITFTKYAPYRDLLYLLLDYVRPVGSIVKYRVITSDSLLSQFTTDDKVTINAQRNAVAVTSSEQYQEESGIVAKTALTNKFDKKSAGLIGFTQVSKTEYEGEE